MKFDYGDEVVTKKVDESMQSSQRPCSVVAITSIETRDQAAAFGYPVGTTLYTVEFGDGTDTTLPEDSLELLP